MRRLAGSLWGLLALAVVLIGTIEPARAQEPTVAAPAAEEDLLSAPSPDHYEFSEFEQRLLDKALSEHNLELLTYAEAQGQTVSGLVVQTEDVFTEEDLWPDVLNIFHVTTRPHVVEREILTRPGQPFDSTQAVESERNLRAAGQVFSIVLVVPVRDRAAPGGGIKILAVVKDIWSLRANTAFLFVGDTLSYLYISLAENNVLGLQKEGALTFLLEQDAISFGQYVLDRRVLDSRVFAGERFRFIFNRDSWDFEGYAGEASLGVPLYSVREAWGWRIDYTGLFEIGRFFEGPSVRTWDNPDTAEIEALPFEWRTRQAQTQARVTRSFGEFVKHNFSLGHAFALQRFMAGATAADRRAAAPTLVASFEDSLLPRSELSSAVFLQAEVFFADFLTLRDLDTFALPEDVRLGPSLDARVSHADPIIGSELRFEQLDATLQYRLLLGDRDDNPSRKADLLVLSTGYTTRLMDADLQDNEVTVGFQNYAPVLGGVRAVVRGALTWRFDDHQNRLATLGGDSALRGFDAGAFLGRSKVIGNLELRTLPWEFYTFHFGGVAFYDVGGVSSETNLSDLAIYHAAGLGLRFLNPASNRIVFRIDYGVSLNAPEGISTDTTVPGISAPLPGKLTIGFEQAF